MKPKPATSRSAWSMLLRLALITMVLGVGWHTLLLYAPFFRSPAGVEQNPVTDVPGAWLTEEGSGFWSLAGQPLSLRVLHPTLDELNQRLNAGPRSGKTGEPMDAAVLLSCLQQIATRRTILDDGLKVYAGDTVGIRWVVVTNSKNGREGFVAGRLAFQESPGLWTLIEAEPLPDRKATSPDHLLPLSGNANVLAQRTSADGRLIAELISLPGSAEALERAWTRDGWRPSSRGEPQGVEVYHSGEQRREVWILQASDTGTLVLVAVREARKQHTPEERSR